MLDFWFLARVYANSMASCVAIIIAMQLVTYVAFGQIRCNDPVSTKMVKVVIIRPDKVDSLFLPQFVCAWAVIIINTDKLRI